MAKVIRNATAIAAWIFLACANQAMRGRIDDYGVTSDLSVPERIDNAELPGGVETFTKRMRIARTTDVIEARLGTSFGYHFTISGLTPGEEYEFEKAVSYPAMTLPDGTVSTGYTRMLPRTTARSDGTVASIQGYGLDFEYELLPGRWTIEIRYEGRMLTSKTFTIVAPPFREETNMEPPSDPYLGLRNLMLSLPLEEMEVHPDCSSETLAVMVDFAVEAGTVTFAAAAEGAVSMYVSGGGGTIGAGAHESVRRAAFDLLAETDVHWDRLVDLNGTIPLPEAGEVRFTARRRDGTRSAVAAESSLRTSGEPLSPLYEATQRLITEFRLLEEERAREEP